MDFFGQKVGLAPMVRVGQLPFRLLALRNGADYVWSEEIIDQKLASCVRKEVTNKINGIKTIDYLLAEDTTVRPVFQTCAEEQGKVILQLGTADPDLALAAAKCAENDVSAVEVNMGCPKGYSTKMGAGAALLSTPDLAAEILKKLVENLRIPVLAKIRCLPDLEDTFDYCVKMAETGISLLTIHGRLKSERPRHNVRLAWVNEIRTRMKEKFPDLPIWLNGVSHNPIVYHHQIQEVFQQTNCDGMMLARAAFRDPTIFKPKAEKPGQEETTLMDICKQWVQIAIDYDATARTIKYVVQEILIGRFGEPGIIGKEIGDKVRSSEFSSQFAEIFGIEYDKRIDSINDQRDVCDEFYPLRERRPEDLVNGPGQAVGQVDSTKSGSERVAKNLSNNQILRSS